MVLVLGRCCLLGSQKGKPPTALWVSWGCFGAGHVSLSKVPGYVKGLGRFGLQLYRQLCMIL